MKVLYMLALGSCLVSLPVFSNEQAIPVPENASVAWVSDSVNQNGMQLAIQTFYSEEPVESVLEFYRAAWHKDGEVPGFVENTLGEWAIISQLRDDSNVVLQVKIGDTGNTKGFLSTATKHPVVSQKAIDFPIPDGTDKFSSSYVEEDDSQVHTMTFISTQSVGDTTNFYRKSMGRKGWKLARDKQVDGYQVMLFNNENGDRCELVVSQLDSESTVIHVNRVKRNG